MCASCNRGWALLHGYKVAVTAGQITVYPQWNRSSADSCEAFSWGSEYLPPLP